MKRQLILLSVFVGLGSVVVSLTQPAGLKANASPSPAAATAVAPADEPAIVEDSMHEFMEYVFQPTYKRLKVSMAAEPSDNNGWKAIKSDSLILAESCNLLFDRTPDDDGADWMKHAAASRGAGAELYKAAREKKFQPAVAAYKKMLDNCNACHRQFEDGRHILKP